MPTHPDVLVVDDDAATRHLLEALFSHAGLTVLLAHDGESAIDLLGEHRVEAVVLDLQMPRVTGFDVLRHLNATQPELLPRVILLTAVSATSLDDTAETFGVWAAIRKPADINSLLATLLDCLAQDLDARKPPARSPSARRSPPVRAAAGR